MLSSMLVVILSIPLVKIPVDDFSILKEQQC